MTFKLTIQPAPHVKSLSIQAMKSFKPKFFRFLIDPSLFTLISPVRKNLGGFLAVLEVTSSDVQRTIENMLVEKLPEQPYTSQVKQEKAVLLYQHIYNSYQGAEQSNYT